MDGLTSTPQEDLAEGVKEPEFLEVARSDIMGRITLKDDLIIYHLYDPTRKAIFDSANEEMDSVLVAGRSAYDIRSRQSVIARRANEELDKHPWRQDYESIIDSVFDAEFKAAPHKTSYYQEVDSWSVILPDSAFPLTPKPEFLKGVVEKLSDALGR
jgi:hypothetical protein